MLVMTGVSCKHVTHTSSGAPVGTGGGINVVVAMVVEVNVAVIAEVIVAVIAEVTEVVVVMTVVRVFPSRSRLNLC